MSERKNLIIIGTGLFAEVVKAYFEEFMIIEYWLLYAIKYKKTTQFMSVHFLDQLMK